MRDLIDRQAVLDFLTDEWDGNILHLFNCIKHIPSAPMKMRMDSYGITVTPAIMHDMAERKTDDLISRQAAIDFIDAGHFCNPNEPRWSDNEIINFLKSRPSAQRDGTDTNVGGTIYRQAAIYACIRVREVHDCFAERR